MNYIDGKTLKLLFKGASLYLSSKKDEINKLNVFPVPDGDTGSNMAYTLEYALKEIDKTKDNINEILNGLSRGALLGAKGNSGVILSQIIRGFTKSLLNKKIITTKDFADALKNGSNVAYKAVMKPVEGTILTVTRECANEAIRLSKYKDFEKFMEELVAATEKSVNNTPNLLLILKQTGVVDSGGIGFLFILKGMLDVIKGKEIIDYGEIKKDISSYHKMENIKFKYCTEMLIKTNQNVSNELKMDIENYGDSLIVVQDDDLIKVHVHSNNPGLVLQKGLKYGELIKVKIDNMKIQHENTIVTTNEPEKKIGILAVAQGDGIKDIFMKLGCNVIDGGQTMNPSTEDILKGIDKINAKNIIIFPNNNNVIMTCQQAKNLISKKNVYVIETKSFNQAISAIININNDELIEKIIENINDTISKVKTIEITYSIRDTKIDEREIKKGDIISFIDGKLIGIGYDYNTVALNMISEVINDDTSLITIFYGKDIDKNKANDLKTLLNNIKFDGDIDIQYGGQPLYYYIISVE